MSLLDHVRRVYYFGYGAERDPEIIREIIGARPRVIGPAIIHDFELRIQNMHDRMKPLPRKILERAWGQSFRSYVAAPKKGARIEGTLYRITLSQRHLIDAWELVEEGWLKKHFVKVFLDSGKTVEAETQILGPGQEASSAANGENYKTYVMPKKALISKTRSLRVKPGQAKQARAR